MPCIKIYGITREEIDNSLAEIFEQRARSIIAGTPEMETKTEDISIFFLGPKGHSEIRIEISVMRTSRSNKVRPSGIFHRIKREVKALADKVLVDAAKEKIKVVLQLSNRIPRE